MGRLSLRLLIFVLFAAAPAAMADAPIRPANVLFVGNSLTYYNNSLHNHYRQLLRAANDGVLPEGRVRIKTISGGRLPEHAGLEAMLVAEPWDAVVLQGHSLGPISPETAEPFRAAARRFVAAIREQGAEPFFFMTWAYKDSPEMTAQLDTAYSGIGQELGATVVPVGLAFETVTRERPDIALRIADKRHPTLAGTYLAACTFYAVFFDSSPAGLEYDAGLGRETAEYLQRVAWSTVVEYRERTTDK